jgi:2-C-methyl-D-erythritol 2,4-cyclodiphosphate synthase
VLHAVCDALLGAAGLGDMGTHFPSDDARWRGADSTLFLREVASRLGAEGISIVNVDVTVIAQAPKLAPHVAAMRAAVARAAGLRERAVSIKIKSTDRLGAVGREEGIAADAVALVRCPTGREPSA